MRDEYAKESLAHCVECDTLKWIHDNDAGICADCLDAIDRTRRPPREGAASTKTKFLAAATLIAHITSQATSPGQASRTFGYVKLRVCQAGGCCLTCGSDLCVGLVEQ